ncbi:acyltransferase [Subtercola endophyticus]|uniref:acyltransferase n=1 Tax=Subtercola endophyticus TaxID=2895559 RepID=UPI001E5CF466|nr:acyltransferase [Subtercola endophyticus]UFS57847.1 acyltransferase [Subtercola endophyticus]
MMNISPISVCRRLWPGLLQEVWANGIAATPFVPKYLRYLFLRAQGFHIEKSRINAHVRWSGSGTVSIGVGVGINQYCDINHSASVTIGAGVALGRGVMIITATHEIGDNSRRCGPGMLAPVTIEEGAWLGARVVIMPGVTIGRGAVVGAGSVVTRSLAPNRVYAGSPAKAIRDLTGQVRPVSEMIRTQGSPELQRAS